MDSGNFRHKIEIQQKTSIRDGYGGETITYTKLADLRCSITYMSGREGFTADRFYGKNIMQFKTRFYPNISTIDRVVFDNRNFDIIHPIKNINEENRYMILTAEEES